MAKIFRCRMTKYIEFDIKADSEDDASDWISTHTMNDVDNKTSDYKEEWDEDVLYCKGTDGYAPIDISSR